MNDNSLKNNAFTLKGSLYTMTSLHLLQADEKLFESQLQDVIAKAPKLFDRAPIVLDFSGIKAEDVDLQSICSRVRESGLIPVAIQGANDSLKNKAKSLGLGTLVGSIQKSEIKTSPPKESTKVSPSLLITSPIRSGQQIVCKDNDIVVTSSVGHGAELLAGGNIHVYGVLRGRALAGISGDRNVRIFCNSLEAELVSIAGFYRLSDSFDAKFGPCQIFLKDEQVMIEPL